MDASGGAARLIGCLASLALYALGGLLYGVADQDTGNFSYEVFRNKTIHAEQNDGPTRILLGGGSNVIWGLRSPLLQAELGVPVTNLAVESEGGDPAAHRKMLLDVVHAGDVVVYSSIAFWSIEHIDPIAASAMLRAAGTLRPEGLLPLFQHTWQARPSHQALLDLLPNLYLRHVKRARGGSHYPYTPVGDIPTCVRTKAKVEPRPFVPPSVPPAIVGNMLAFRDQLGQKGARLVVEVPWFYVSEGERSQWLEAYGPVLAALRGQMVVATRTLEDAVSTDESLFCDTTNHLTDSAALVRTHALALFLRSLLAT